MGKLLRELVVIAALGTAAGSIAADVLSRGEEAAARAALSPLCELEEVEMESLADLCAPGVQCEWDEPDCGEGE